MARKKKISVEQFRAWLEGVEEMQPDGWTPNDEQWKRIRQKIDMIEEEVVVEERIVSQQSYAPPPQQQQRPNNPPPAPAGGPPVQSTLTPEPASIASPRPQPSGSGKIKTPDIDTSGGEYMSGFE